LSLAQDVLLNHPTNACDIIRQEDDIEQAGKIVSGGFNARNFPIKNLIKHDIIKTKRTMK